MTKSDILNIFLTGCLCAGLGSCASDDISDNMNEPDDPRLVVTASSLEQLGSRSYTHDDNGGVVKSGKFWFYYPNTGGTYVLGDVDFDIQKNGTAYITNGKEVVWDDIGRNPTSLYLDNVNPGYVTYNSQKRVWVFNNSNPFVTGPIDDANDILWGETTQKRNSRYIDFDLNHVMAGVRVKITIDNSEELADNIDLSKAELYLTHIVDKPYSFDRLTGNVAIKDEPSAQDYTNLTFVDNLLENSQQLEWASVSLDDNGYDVYMTNDFILPPQSPDINDWPQLVVRFPNPSPETSEEKPYLEFFGYIPHAMETDYPTGTNYAMNLSFLREHILEIRTRISQNPPQLVFMPVKVYNWIDKGSYRVIGNQEGIYNETEFLNIVNYYASNNISMLKRFGELKYENGTNYWKFTIFRTITVNKSDIYGKMIPDPSIKKYNYIFSFNRYSVIVVDDDGTSTVINNNDDLYDLLTGND